MCGRTGRLGVRTRTAPSFAVRVCLSMAIVFIACASVSSCTGARVTALLDRFAELSDCDRVVLFDSILTSRNRQLAEGEKPWLQPSVMRAMANRIVAITWIGRAYSDPCPDWDEHCYGHDSLWKRLIPLWAQSLQCDEPSMKREELLRLCDPVAADLMHFVSRMSAVTRDEKSGVRMLAREVDEIAPRLLTEFESTLNGDHSAVSIDPLRVTYGRMICNGLLPNDSAPDAIVIFARLRSDRLIAKVVPRGRDTTAYNAAALKLVVTVSDSFDDVDTLPGIIILFAASAGELHQIASGAHPVR